MSTSRKALACEGIEVVDTPGGCKVEKMNWTELTLSWELLTSGPTDLSGPDSDWGPVVAGGFLENIEVRSESFNFLEIKWNELFNTNTPCSLRPSNIKGTDKEKCFSYIYI
jgi:hypothetical protein